MKVGVIPNKVILTDFLLIIVLYIVYRNLAPLYYFVALSTLDYLANKGRFEYGPVLRICQYTEESCLPLRDLESLVHS